MSDEWKQKAGKTTGLKVSQGSPGALGAQGSGHPSLKRLLSIPSGSSLGAKTGMPCSPGQDARADAERLRDVLQLKVSEPGAAEDNNADGAAATQTPCVVLHGEHEQRADDGCTSQSAIGKDGELSPARGLPRSPARTDAGKRLQELKAKSQEQERRVAKMLGGLRVPASGALGVPGDVDGLWLLVECKHREGRTVPLHLDEVEKITAEAEGEGKTPAFSIEMADLKPGIEKDWVLLPLRVLAALRGARHAEPLHLEQGRRPPP